MANSTKTSGSGFCMLPWRESFREGGIENLSSPEIAVLPVLVIHANQDRKAYPGYELISAIAQVSKTTVAKAIESLVAKKLIAKSTDVGKVYSHNVYKLLFSYDKNNGDASYKRQWIALHRELFDSGAWGKMSPSIRRVYLILRAFAWAGINANRPDENDTGFVEVYERGKWRKLNGSDIQFLSGRVYEPAMFARLSDVKERTYRKAMEWLVENSLIIPYDGDKANGFVIPFWPKVYFSDVVAAIEKAQKATVDRRNKASTGAKRSLGAAIRRQNAPGKPTSLAGKKQG